MNAATLALAKKGLADLLEATKHDRLAPDRLAVIEAAKYGIKVAENQRKRGPRLNLTQAFRKGWMDSDGD